MYGMWFGIKETNNRKLKKLHTMRHLTKHIKVIAKVSMVLILLSFLGLKSKAADNSNALNNTEVTESVKIK